jgi:hypothetical protein
MASVLLTRQDEFRDEGSTDHYRLLLDALGDQLVLRNVVRPRPRPNQSIAGPAWTRCSNWCAHYTHMRSSTLASRSGVSCIRCAGSKRYKDLRRLGYALFFAPPALGLSNRSIDIADDGTLATTIFQYGGDWTSVCSIGLSASAIMLFQTVVRLEGHHLHKEQNNGMQRSGGGEVFVKSMSTPAAR